MATVGSINVSLKASSTSFGKAMKEASGYVSRFAGVAKKASLAVAGFGAAITAGTTAALAAMTKAAMGSIDATAKFADRIGMTTEGLVGLQHAAELTGVQVSALQMGLQRATRRIAEAAQGTGEAKGALKELGLEAEALAAMRPEDAFGEIAEAMAKVTNQGDRVRLAMKLFDSEGVALVNTLALGKKGLEEVRAEADALGLSFSRIEAAQVEAANDALIRAKGIFTGIGRTLAVEVAPMIEAAARSFVEWAKSGEGVGGKVADGIELLVRVAGTAADVFGVLKGTFKLAGAVGAGAFALVTRVLGEAVDAAETLVSTLTLGFVKSDFGSRMKAFSEEIRREARSMLYEGAADVSAGVAGEYQRQFVDGLRAIQREARKTAEELHRTAEAAAPLNPNLARPEYRTLGGPGAGAGAVGGAAVGGITGASSGFDPVSIREEIAQRRLAARFTSEELAARRDVGRLLELEALGYREIAAELRETLALEKGRAENLRAEEAKARLVEEVRRSQDEATRKAKETERVRSEIRLGLERELEVLRAGTDFDRERVRLAHELADLTKRHAEDSELVSLAKERHAEKLAEIAKAEAEAQARITQEKRAQAGADSRKNTDPLKGFVSPGGGGIFGFGAGAQGFTFSPGYGDMGRHGMHYRSKGGAAAEAMTEKASGAKGAVEAATQAVEELTPAVRTMTTAATDLAHATKRAAESIREAVVGATVTLKRKVLELDSEVRTLREEVARAADLGVAGG